MNLPEEPIKNVIISSSFLTPQRPYNLETEMAKLENKARKQIGIEVSNILSELFYNLESEIEKGFKSIEVGHFVNGKVAMKKLLDEAEPTRSYVLKEEVQTIRDEIEEEKICDNCLNFGEYVEYNQAICNSTGELCHRLQKCKNNNFVYK